VLEKTLLMEKWSQCKDDSTYLRYKQQANKASKAVRLAKRDFERKIAKNIKRDSKSFFAYTKSKSKVRSSVGP